MFGKPVPSSAALNVICASGDLEIGRAAGDGDCFFLSALAAMGLITPEEAANPSDQTLNTIEQLRNACADKLAGSSCIGKQERVPASSFRKFEGLPEQEDEAMVAFKPWRALGFWVGAPGLSAAMHFATADYYATPIISLQREIIDGKEVIFDPAIVYGQRTADNDLVMQTDSSGESVPPALTLMPLEEVVKVIKSKKGTKSMPAVIIYDPSHFSPLLPNL